MLDGGKSEAALHFSDGIGGTPKTNLRPRGLDTTIFQMHKSAREYQDFFTKPTPAEPKQNQLYPPFGAGAG
jgi:hypothetical protein